MKLSVTPLIATFGLAAALTSLAPSYAKAEDAFDRFSNFQVRDTVRNLKPVESLTSGAVDKLKRLAPKMENGCIVLKTNGGNWTKALIGWGFRRSALGKPLPVLVIEKFVTYDGQREGVAIASGKDVMLFTGFSYSFDIGQVVPPSHVCDITFTEDRTVKSFGDANLYPIDGVEIPARDPNQHDPNDHEDVLPRDFAATWLVQIDGRWSGRIVLGADIDGNITGRFTSDETKSDYPVKGKVTSTPHRATFDTELVNAQQSFDAFLWTKDKSTMAGTVSINGRRLGFYAVREKPAKKDGAAPDASKQESGKKESGKKKGEEPAKNDDKDSRRNSKP